MNQKSRREETSTYGAKLTVREIRGLLTKIGAELAQSAGEPDRGEAMPAARQIRTREIIERMTPFLRMN